MRAAPGPAATGEMPERTRLGAAAVLDRVTRFYGPTPALREVSVTLRKGVLTVLLGPSGSGKSTLLNMIAGIDVPSSGTVEVLGETLQDRSSEALAQMRLQQVAVVFQQYNLLTTLRVIDNVALPLVLRGDSQRAARRVAEAELAAVGLDRMAARMPGELSGGEQQRAAFARALAGQQEIILADEPTGALDSANSRIVIGLLEEAVARGRTCVVATHNPEVAAHAEDAIELLDGRAARQP